MAEPKFEKDLEALEKIVEKLEEGGLPLDEALKQFEQGIKLAKRCEKALSDAEKKIEILTKTASGEYQTEPFGVDEEAGENSSGENASNSNRKSEPSAAGDTGEEEGELLF